MMQKHILLALVASMCVVSLAQASDEELEPHSDRMTYAGTSTLQCTTTLNGYQPMMWFRNGEEIKESDKYIIDGSNNTLTIKHTVEADVGVYQCRITPGNGANYTRDVFLYADPYVNPFETSSKNLVQGDTLTLHCQAWGYPLPTASWLKDGQPIDMDDERVSLSDHGDVVNGTLDIANLDYPDRADYTCVAVNEDGQTANATVLVRVKDKLAALWPFLGICCEVIVLCIIIFIYEKRRAKKMVNDDAGEETGHLTNSHEPKHKDDVRQRK